MDRVILQSTKFGCRELVKFCDGCSVYMQVWIGGDVLVRDVQNPMKMSDIGFLKTEPN